MDPMTIATSLITLATFLKDLIELGQGIRASIEKVGENRRRIRGLTNDILRILADLANLTRGYEDTFQAPALLSALGNLKAEMLHVLSVCRDISPAAFPGFQRFGSQLKVWIKRDDLEKKIGRLKEHVNACYLQFTAFSAVRIEQTTARIEDTSLHAVNTALRVEQALIVHNVESQVKLRRLEGMMARMLLETQFGQNVMNQTIEIIASDPNHLSIESQYLSVQSLRLIDSLHQSLKGGNLVLHEPLWDPTRSIRLRFSKESPSRVLHWILGKVLEIHESPAAGIPLKAMRGMLMNLGICLTNLDMISEGIAWERLKICILRYMASGEHSAGTLPQLAMAFRELSLGYLRQLRLELALQASDQSLGLWRHISETLPEVDHRVGLVTAMSMHAEALLQSGQVAAALSLAQEAVAIARPMVARIIASGSEPVWAEEDEFEAVTFSELSFILAEALASAGRHYESYETAKEVFEIMLGLPISEHPPPVTTIDSFLNQICKMAEQDSFPLVMLADCVILFRDLVHKFAGQDPQICSHLVWLLYAYVYFSRQDNSSSMDTLRMFLEPSSEHPPPELDASGNPMACIDLFNEAGSVVQDAVRAFYAYRWSDTSSLIRTIFVTHFEQAIGVFREVIERACSDASLQAASTEWAQILEWVLYSTLGILDTLPFFDNSKRVALLQIMAKSISHLGTLFTRVSNWEFSGSFIADSLFRELWAIGLLDDALAVSTHKIEHFYNSSHDTVDNPPTGLIERALLLYDMGRFQEAVQSVQQLQAVLPESVVEYERRNVLCLIQTRILLRTERNREAIQLLRKRVAERKFYHKVDSDFLLFVELATAWASVGHPRRALQAVELAVVGTDFDAEKGSQTEWALRMHVFTTRSDCLSATGLDSEAFAAAQQATRLYNENAQHIMFSTIRIKEWGANAFRALSCRYAVADAYGVPDPYQALVTAQTATKLYRELVELAPTHLPILARSLRDLASNLWTVGRRDESAATCDEAANIMRNVVIAESYFLPALAEVLEQLAGYLKETGSAARASAATAECAEVRRKFESLPPEPDFIFEEIKMEWADEDEGNDGNVWEIVGNSDDEYCDVSRAAADIEEVVSPGEAPTGVFQDVTLPNPLVFSDPEPSEVSVSAGVFTRVDSEVSLAASPPTYLNATSTSATSQLTSGEEKVDPATDTETHKTGKRRVSDLLNTPLEVKLSTTPMNILWWVLVGILSILVGILSVALAVVLSRRP